MFFHVMSLLFPWSEVEIGSRELSFIVNHK